MRSLKALREVRASREQKLAVLPGNMAFKLPDLERAAERWNEKSLRVARRALRTADRRVKTGGNAATALAGAIAEACSEAGRASPARRGR